jgi:hypothetical protein
VMFTVDTIVGRSNSFSCSGIGMLRVDGPAVRKGDPDRTALPGFPV